jgi:hypothetical protein
MESYKHRESMASIENAQHKYVASKELIHKCFAEDIRLTNLTLHDYLTMNQYVMYMGMEITWGFPHVQVESITIPERILKEYYEIEEAEEECTSWIRMWSMLAEDHIDFNAGLPGGSLEFSSTELSEQYHEMAASDTFKQIEGKYFAYLLLGK